MLFDDKLFTNLQSLILPELPTILELVRECKKLMYFEKNCIDLTGAYNVVGDIHGQFFDLLNIFDLFGYLPDKNYLFLGDYVDRGANSVETILYLLGLKLKHPNQIFLLRGNHETENLTQTYGFMKECLQKLDLTVYLEICDLFNYLPLCAVINNKYFCCHGGITPQIELLKSLEEYERVDNCIRVAKEDHVMGIDSINPSDIDKNSLKDDPEKAEFTKAKLKGKLIKTAFEGILWSDPYETDHFVKNPRGAGYLFGKKQADEFCAKNNVAMIVRSHQLVMEGYKIDFDKVITIWSAPNYCYKNDNVACIMEISENIYKFLVFDKCDEQTKCNLDI